MEEGLQSAWLYETPSPHVDELVVAGIAQSRGPKSDWRRVRLGGGAPRGQPRQARLGGVPPVHSSTGSLPYSYDAGRRCRTSAGADEGRLLTTRSTRRPTRRPLAWRSRDRHRCLQLSSPPTLAGSAVLRCTDQSDTRSTIDSTSCRGRRSGRRPTSFERPRSIRS